GQERLDVAARGLWPPGQPPLRRSGVGLERAAASPDAVLLGPDRGRRREPPAAGASLARTQHRTSGDTRAAGMDSCPRSLSGSTCVRHAAGRVTRGLGAHNASRAGLARSVMWRTVFPTM